MCLGVVLGCAAVDPPERIELEATSDTTDAHDMDATTTGIGPEPGESSTSTTEDPSSTETTGAPAACETEHEQRACVTETGAEGLEFCWRPSGETLQWSDCVEQPECTPGELRECVEGGESGGGGDLHELCVVHDGEPTWECSFEEWCGCSTPLVLSFDGAEPQLDSASAAFDIDVAGGCLTTDWPEASTPWLAIDRDGDGAIADGRELFGSGTRLRSGARAPHGFAALAELDDDGNGIIDARDAGFAELVLWSDGDSDKRGTATELEPAGARLLALELAWHADRQCDARGNCGIERASFTWIDRDGSLRTGTIVDVHLACQ